jgi:hypothetical protein
VRYRTHSDQNSIFKVARLPPHTLKRKSYEQIH